MLSSPHTATSLGLLTLTASAALVTSCASPNTPVVLAPTAKTPPKAAPKNTYTRATLTSPRHATPLKRLNRQLETLAQLAAKMDPTHAQSAHVAVRRAFLFYERAQRVPASAPSDLRAIVHVADAALAHPNIDARAEADLIYLRGLAHDLLGDDQAAARDLAHAAQHHPDPHTRTDALVRRAERAFELDPAQAVPLYHEALKAPGLHPPSTLRYKLAWSLYRLDRYPEAIEHFALVALNPDAQADLTDEAIQYIAISLAEDDWDGDGIADSEPRTARAERLLTPYPKLRATVLGHMIAVLRDLAAPNTEIEQLQTLCKRDLGAPCPEPTSP